jgi:hypothetical protein
MMIEEINLDGVADSESAIEDSCVEIQRKLLREIEKKKKRNPDIFPGELIRDVYEGQRHYEDQSKSW